MTIGKLSVQLGLQSSQFNTGIRNAGSQVRTFSNTIDAQQTRMQRFAAGVTAMRMGAGSAIAGLGGVFAGLGPMVAGGLSVAAAAIAAGVISRALRNEISEIDRIAKTAQKLGMIPEQLVGLQHAAALAGVGTEKMDMSLQRMTRRISEAAKGAGEAQGALAELGLDAGMLAQMTPDQAFMRVADAMAKVESQSDKIRLAFKLFDSEGVDLVRVMAGGSAAIREAIEDAKELGVTFSEIDAQQIAEANDALHRMGQAFTAIKRQAAIALAPVFEMIANGLTAIAKPFNAFVKTWAAGFMLMQMDAIRASAKIWQAFRYVFGDSEWRRSVQNWLNESLVKIEAKIWAMEHPAEGVGNAIANIGGEVDEVTEAVNELKEAMDFRPKWIEEGTQEFYDLKARWEEMNRLAAKGAPPQPALPAQAPPRLEPMIPERPVIQEPMIPEPPGTPVADWRTMPAISGRDIMADNVPEWARGNLPPWAEAYMTPDSSELEPMIPEPIRQRIEYDPGVIPVVKVDPIRVPIEYVLPENPRLSLPATQNVVQEPRNLEAMERRAVSSRGGDDRVLGELKAMSKQLGKLDAIAAETARTTNASARTAQAIEEWEPPVVVNF